MPLLECIEKKLTGWKSRLLSQGGRLILLRHVFSSLTIHLLSLTQMPKAVIRKLNGLFANFFWGRAKWYKQEEMEIMEEALCASGGRGYWRKKSGRGAALLIFEVWVEFVVLGLIKVKLFQGEIC
ncbi:hypothetical protein I3760_01G177000 [Carya illinoinensis]|nr:hypothetical protein I3760_01G177000 [Carya illinoinensis]